MKKYMTVEMPDGSVWGVPVDMIARHRAAYFAKKEFNGDVEESLKQDTWPLFFDDEYAIEDWAVNNMNYSDFNGHQIKIKDSDIDIADAWCNGEKGYVMV